MLDIALKNAVRQRARSFLTILGIAMGIGLILALGAVGEGLNRQVEESFSSLAGVIVVVKNWEFDDAEITDDLIEDLKDLAGVESVIPIGEYRITRGGKGMRGMKGMGGLFHGGGGDSSLTLTLTALYPEDQDYLIYEEIIAEEGRKLDESDAGSQVVLLGHNTAEVQLLNVGDEIEYERVENDSTEYFYFDVIGILEETGDGEIDDSAYVPITAMQEIEDDEEIKTLIVLVEDVEDVEDIADTINNEFEDVVAISPITIIRSIQSVLSTIQMAVYGIGAISVIVGGIGIMNTMIMSVMERRREIGIMKAIGATTTDILTQVLQESAILSLIGGICGVALGYFAASVITEEAGMMAVITPELVGIGLAFSLVLGMGAGLYPAWSASQLDPIEVLRYE